MREIRFIFLILMDTSSKSTPVIFSRLAALKEQPYEGLELYV